MTPSDQTAPLPQLLNAVPVRVVAVDIFDRIAHGGETMDRAFADTIPFAQLNTLDRALVRMMVTTTIRRLGQIDDIIENCMNGAKPNPRLLQSVLRLSVAQLVFMNVPDHAAVNLGVELAVKMGLERQKGLVNAVLRRAAREGKDRTTRQDIPRLNTPEWLMNGWTAVYGKNTAMAIAQANLTEAALDISVADKTKTDDWAAALSADVLPTGTLRIMDPSGTIDHLPGFDEGAWWVQDASAALPVYMMGDIAGKRIVDMCAAPGGKTAQLAAAGANVTALDRSTPRIDILHRNLARLKMDAVTVIEADGIYYESDTPFDIALIDAPCTATGTIRRNPDIILHRTPDDVIRMSVVQAKLLHNAAQLIVPGGLIVYAVCSLQWTEGEGQIEHFLTHHPDFKIEKITGAQVGGQKEFLTPEGFLRILPTHLKDKGGMDGFFTAYLRHMPA